MSKFSPNYEHCYDFSVSGRTYAEIEQAAMDEAKRYYGEVDFVIIRIDTSPATYTYEAGQKTIPLALDATVSTRGLRPLDGGTTRTNNRRRSRTGGAGGQVVD